MGKRKFQLSMFDEPKPATINIPCPLCALAFHSGKLQYFSPALSDADLKTFTNPDNFLRWKRILQNSQPKAK